MKLEVKEKSHDNIVVLNVAHCFPYMHLFVYDGPPQIDFSVFGAARSHDNMIMELSVNAAGWCNSIGRMNRNSVLLFPNLRMRVQKLSGRFLWRRRSVTS